MKNILLLIGVLLIGTTALAQNGAIQNVALDKNNLLSFTMKKEINTSYFLLQASENGKDFEIIQRFDSRGNCMIPQTYQYRVYLKDYTHYYVSQVQMDGSTFQSAIMQLEKPHQNLPTPSPISTPQHTIAYRK